MNINEWAEALANAIARHEVKPTLAAEVPDADEQTAYEVQQAVIGKLEAMGSVAGFKSALTNTAAQAAFAWHSPMSGVLLEGMEQTLEAPVRFKEFSSGVIETEIGLRVGRLIDSPVTAASLPDFLSEALPMIELGDVGFSGPPSPLDLIAANAAASRFIQGAGRPVETADEVRVTLHADGELLHEGHATDAMGSVLEAGAWLVNHCLSQGYQLLPGQLLMTGSLGQIQRMGPNEYRADYGDFGCLEFEVVA